ncbi:hypothetical protein LUZ62_081583 [Rhynchospora pubera]|uniref:Fe2OG dioxygenase domain-containing protein n=1 Tax=Rhynchospora pubera TaxID=906938 RepID=A0AAV8BVE9_9POAL|nr:hypothetical protein LUZ62_081583 [Rhynchospora pubera]
MATPTDATSACQTNTILKEFKEFDDTKAGVKGLVDCGIEKIPEFFIQPQELLLKSSEVAPPSLQVPIIDLEAIHQDADSYKQIVQELKQASESWGFFQLVNHNVPKVLLDEVIKGIKEFNEGNKDEKEKLYSRDIKKKVSFASNLNLYQMSAANWRDTLNCLFDDSFDPTEIPLVCRDAFMKYRENLLPVAETLYELLSVALGLPSDHIRGMNCAKTQIFVAHYYPPCPEPQLTMGTSTHTDPSFVTFLLQDSLGGLQILHDDHWVDVTPIPGALVVNIGDLLQLASNDKFKSTKHRVLASTRGPRISLATFLVPAFDKKKPFGPIKELLSDKNPPLYKEVLATDYLKSYVSKGLNSSALSYFKL